MVGPTWSRVAYSLGLDYILVVVSEDLPRGLLVAACVILYVPVGCVSCHVSLPPAVACVPFHPIAPCSWGCNSMFRRLVIMRVCVCSWYLVSHDGLCITILKRTIVLVTRSQVC